MSDFMAKMYQIQFLSWGSARPPSWIKGPTSKGRGEEEGEVGGEGIGRERGGEETPPLHAPLIHISEYAPELDEVTVGSKICDVRRDAVMTSSSH